VTKTSAGDWEDMAGPDSGAGLDFWYRHRGSGAEACLDLDLGTNLFLSWTIPSMDFVLRQDPDLTTTNWTDVAVQPTLNLTNLQNQVVLPTPPAPMFYRLVSVGLRN